MLPLARNLRCSLLRQQYVRALSTTPPASEFPPKVVVLGGNGYVGQRVVQALLLKSVDVTSINRSGQPKNIKGAWPSHVKWVAADVFDEQKWAGELEGAIGVVSTIGAFGNNEFMEKICGDANIKAAETAKKAGVKNFVFVSTSENNLPEFILKGYFHGKKRAEAAVQELFPETGVVLRPSFIYGTRQVGNMEIPLSLVGKPLEFILRLPPFPILKDSLPGAKALLVPPVPVEAVGSVAAKAAMGELPKGIYTVDDIAKASQSS